MSPNPNKLSRFWSELKRRRVVHVTWVYGSASFVLIELINNLSEPLNLPGGLSTIVIILLAVGFPLAAILGWIYDLTPEGIEKTRPLEEIEEGETKSVPNAWKIATYASFMVIAGLILMNVLQGPAKLHAGDIQSLVILPFDNYTGDTQLGNMVEGMHSLLIGDMGRVSNLRVIGKTSSGVFEKAEMTAKDIAGELGVDAVVEASVMCLGDSICMQFRLVSTNGDEKQLWVGDYKEDKSQILNMYNRVTKKIAEEVLIQLTEKEEVILIRDRSGDGEAIDAYIKSYKHWGDLGPDALNEAEEILNQAIEKYSEWAPLYSTMALVWIGRMQMGMVEIQAGLEKVYENLDQAFELDPDFPDSHFCVAVISTWYEWNWEKGEKEFLKALAVNPNHVMSRMYYAHLLMILQRMAEATTQAELALALDPMNPLILALYSVVQKGAGQDRVVLESIKKALRIDPDHSFTHYQRENAYYNLGEYTKSLEIQQSNLSASLSGEPDLDLISIYRDSGKQVAYEEVVRLKELCGERYSSRPISLAVDYYRIGAHRKAIDALEKGLAIHNPNMPYIGTGGRFEALHDSARFLAVLDSMNLPHPRHN
ncbi:MAG: hypothetical protein P1P86_14855 [Bacteroidales bacterium]|nr:hypothetical protein [Bacteroidales bacterium]